MRSHIGIRAPLSLEYCHPTPDLSVVPSAPDLLEILGRAVGDEFVGIGVPD
jgi:hypothetical protein